MTQILITGAGGFIGGFMVEQGLAEGMTVWAGVRRTTSREYLTDERIRFVDLPYNNPEKLREALLDHKQKHGKWDYIIHNLGVTKCNDPADFERINYGYLRNFVEALEATDMTPRKFVMMSSLSALGPGDETGYTPIRRDDTATPNTAYGRSKLLAERFLESRQGFPWIILRPTGVYGPREKDYFLMVKSVKAGFDVGAGYRPQLITFIYVRDLVDCAYTALKSDVVCRTYNVAEGRAYSSKDFGRYVARELGKRFVVSFSVPLFVLKAVSLAAEQIGKLTHTSSTLNSDKYNIMKQRNWDCDITPLQTELGFTPKWSLEAGVRETVAWYREHGWI
jgi:nucleoside-diphosphate-sugar epimerase